MHGLYDIAIVGATGVVGEAFLKLLEERQFPVGVLHPLASAHSEGSQVTFLDRLHTVSNVAHFDFSKVHIAFFSAGADCSRDHVPRAAESGCLVIDNTPCFRHTEGVPLVVPEVNADTIKQPLKKRIIANPNCTTIALAVALKPIYDRVGIARVNIVTCQSVSGAGRAGLQELEEQTYHVLDGKAVASDIFPKQMAFNVIPCIDDLESNGYTKEEWKLVSETRKIFSDASLKVNPTAIRVPVFVGHSAAVHIETKQAISIQAVRRAFLKAQGVVLIDQYDAYPTPVTHAAHRNEVFVGRLRRDVSHPHGVDFWITADNIRKGAALNAIQIAELWRDQHKMQDK